eukprot:TRINITY_DN4779_c0_g1_i2.p1 TRINITY_DN4779_c0_g1~~TRINITY_DN4779_c0_g1_i2.p1  ORF type:complete len:179 (+),score=25.44 TRINITY_DN4779_c0_g1_i2:764-1300(+)
MSLRTPVGYSSDVDVELIEHCTKKLKSDSPLAVHTKKVALLQDHVVGFSAQNMAAGSFRHDYGFHVPSTSGIWDTKNKLVVPNSTLPSVWKSFDPSIQDLLELLQSAYGISNVVLTQKDVEDAHKAYGGMGADATLPHVTDGVFHCWKRGHTGMRGTNYSHYQFKLPKTPTDKLPQSL